MADDAAEYTLGTEEEYQLVDEETGELRSRARAVLEADWTGEIKPEMQLNTVEVGTRVCRTAVELRAELERLRLAAAVAAESGGMRAVAAGTHPFSHWAGQEFTPSPVYQRIRSDYRRLADTQNIFGMHIHVAIPEGVDRARVMNVARLHLPLLLALSASSPRYLGEDTGYASYRSILWRRWPRTGAPPRFEDDAQYRALLRWLVEGGFVDGPGRIYWDLRPHHVYPTLEFRVADVTPRLDDAVAIAALARALVVGVVEETLLDPEVPEALLQPFLSENAWRAARRGLESELIEFDGGTPRAVPAREMTESLLERLAPVLARCGDEAAVVPLRRLLAEGGAASRIRAYHEESGGDEAALVRWLADETVLGLGLDRRGEQRAHV